MKIETGNAQDAETRGTGWFLGFGDWTVSGGANLLHVPKEEALSGLCVKWYDHPDGHCSDDSKPVSEGTTISILVSGNSEFRIDFCQSPDFRAGRVETVVLRRPGDYVAWGEGIFHRWSCLTRSTILTVRWKKAGS